MTSPRPVPRSLEENSSLAMRSSSSPLIPCRCRGCGLGQSGSLRARDTSISPVPAGHGFQGVGQHVVDHLLDLLAVGDDVDRRRGPVTEKRTWG